MHRISHKPLTKQNGCNCRKWQRPLECSIYSVLNIRDGVDHWPKCAIWYDEQPNTDTGPLAQDIEYGSTPCINATWHLSAGLHPVIRNFDYVTNPIASSKSSKSLSIGSLRAATEYLENGSWQVSLIAPKVIGSKTSVVTANAFLYKYCQTCKWTNYIGISHILCCNCHYLHFRN